MKVISVKFKESGRAYYFDPKELEIKEGEFVIVETARGVECGEVVRSAHEIASADNRVDFRELVKDLAGQFHTRIELRQIGVRDESKMLGGLGVCGQPFCCSRFLKNFQPVSIKMAKEQGLSLNPAKISGACGRLMCCLAYEQKSYEYLNSITPQPGSVVRTPDGEGTVLEANVVAGTLKVRSNVESLAPKIYKRSECTYLRGGRRAPVEPDPDHT